MKNEELKHRRKLRQQRINKLLGFDDEGDADAGEPIPPEKFEVYELGCFFEKLSWDEFEKRFGDTHTDNDEDTK